MQENQNIESMLYGIGGSPGICIGKAYLVDKSGVDVVPKFAIAKKKLGAEKKRFKTAVKKTTDELREIIENTPRELREHARILETHAVLLKDKMLYGKTIETIGKEGINAEWALTKVISILRPMFESINDAYLRDRAEDIAHVSERIMKNLVGVKEIGIGRIVKPVILVARDLSPAETSQIQLDRVMGFVTDGGGRASHTSIIARSLGIPAVLGLEKATRTIHNDDIIIVDGTAGVVVLNPSEETLVGAGQRKHAYEEQSAVLVRSSHLPAETEDGVRLPVRGNIEMPKEVVAVLNKGGDGIGLYRTEFQYIARTTFPSEDELFDNYKEVIEVMPNQPVTIRTLDINGDKSVAYIPGDAEVNPALGLRSIRYCLHKPHLFKTQLRAILRAAHYGEVRILIPMISQIEEIVATKEILKDVTAALRKEGRSHGKDVKLGVMIEVPSAAILADAFAREVDFFSIGTNDLIQFTMAIDRDNRHLAHLYNPLHPAIIRLLKHIADAARGNGVPVFMCGEMAGEPINLPILLGLGLDELSVNPQAIPLVKNGIRSIKAADTEEFLAKVMHLSTARQVEELVQSTYGDLLHNNLQWWED